MFKLKKYRWSFLILIAISSSAEAQWELLHFDTTSVNYSIHFFDECHGVLCGGQSFDNEIDGFIAVTDDCGISWDTVYWATQPLYDMHFPSDDVGYACGFATTVIKTTDGGQSWVNLDVSSDPEINPWHHLSTIHFIDENFGYTSKADGLNVFLRTEDGGDSWQTDSVTSGVRDIFFSNNSHGFVVGGGAFGLKTYDAGENWDMFYTNTESRTYHCVFFKENTGFLGGFGWDGTELFFNYACLAQSEDGGESWTNRDILEMQYIHQISFVNDQVGLAVGTDFFDEFNFLKTVDGGQTWGWQEFEDYAPSLINTVRGVSFVDDNIWYAVGNNGKIWKTMNAGGDPNYEFPYSDIGEVLVAEFMSPNIEVYPNPTNYRVTIMKPATIQQAQLEIYNFHGQLVHRAPILEQKHIVSVESWASGLYVAILKDDEVSLMNKFVVQR